MRSFLIALLASLPLFAVEPPPRSPRPIFPDDYKPHPCAPTACESFDEPHFRSAAFRFLGMNLQPRWYLDHDEEMRKLIEPYCAKRNTCLATPGNSHLFCDDLMAEPIRSICDTRYPKETMPVDWEQCHEYMETYVLGMSQLSLPRWREAQECLKDKPVVTHAKPLDLWLVPEKITPSYAGFMTFYAIDPDTHVPVLAHISFEGQDQTIYAPSNPTGETATGYPYKAIYKLVRVPNAEGHTDVVPPLVTVRADSYPLMTFRLPMTIPKMIVEMKPSAKELRRGKNTVTVFAHDSETGKPVEARVMLGERVAGDTNEPLVIEKNRREKLPEIWVTSLYDQYSDVVAAPREK